MRKYFMAVILAASICFGNFLPLHAADEIYLGGDSIGIELMYDGVMVSGTYRFTIDNTTYDPSNVLRSGDIIESIDGKRIHSIDELFAVLRSFNKQGSPLVSIGFLRNNEHLEASIPIVFDTASNSYKTGLYVKDKLTGVGTLTYYDPSNQSYGALGHEIYDVEIKQLAQASQGSIYPAIVTSIQKAQNNVPGEKHANILYSDRLGDVKTNFTLGIYGTYTALPKQAKRLPWAKQEEIELGEATLYTVIKGQKIEAFTIEITKLHKQSEPSVKGIEFVVKDERLKQASNGIVQGMSGSPIVQNGKIIGAITHVVTSNPMSGYGLYIEFMLNASRNL